MDLIWYLSLTLLLFSLDPFYLNTFINHEANFTGGFWRALMDALKIQLGMSTAFHLQTDRQTEGCQPLVSKSLGIINNVFGTLFCLLWRTMPSPLPLVLRGSLKLGNQRRWCYSTMGPARWWQILHLCFQWLLAIVRDMQVEEGGICW